MKNQSRKLMIIFAVGMLLASQSVMAATTEGPYALDLAAVVAVNSPVLSRAEKRVMERLLGGHTNGAFPATKKILVRVDAVRCVESDVDLSHHSCTLTFGAKSISITGRSAHELFATLAEAGVPPDVAVGSIFEHVSNLVCTINPHIIAQKAGGGADCSFHPNP